ncbi:MAG TPA: terminase family protein, partial [Burkholderiales bacterium]|nr:terminase family protein [Burkholderiales bacterium]
DRRRREDRSRRAAGEGADVEAADLIEIPYAPRRQFLGLHERGTRWAIAVAHRRAGKTVACVNDLIKAAATCERPNARFAYIAPQLNQAKDIAWQYLLEYSECFGPERKINAGELWIELPDNGARVRLYGADNPNRLRGIYLDGAVLDEFGDMDPTVWSQVIRPALSDRRGWAVFIGTPKGRNGFHALWAKAQEDRDWFTLSLKASETRLLDDKELADARKVMSDDEYAQEYECSFEAAVRGAYYGKELTALEQADPPQIGPVPHDPRLPVHTAWDLGIADSTVIWFIQTHGRETRVIDVLKGEGVGLDWYAKRLQERDYLWGNHYLPHDAEVRELGTGKSRMEVLHELGIKGILCPSIPVEDGIQAARMLLPTCWFDKAKCKDGIEALRMYRRDWDDKRQEFRLRPLHDWTSHYADAFRYFAVGHSDRPAMKAPKRDVRWVV